MRIALETSILTAVIAAQYFLFDSSDWRAAFITLVVLGYIVWAAVPAVRARRDSGRPPFTVRLLIGAIQISAAFITGGLVSVAVFAWISWGYRINFGEEATTAWLISGVAVAAPALFLAIIALWPGRVGGPAADLRAAIHRKGFGPFRRSWLGAAAFILAIIYFIVIFGSEYTMRGFLEDFNAGAAQSWWDMALAFPFLPLGLIAGAAMLSVFRTTAFGGASSGAIVRAYTEEAGNSAAPVSGASASLAVVGGLAVTLYVGLYPLHLNLVPLVSLTPDIAGYIETETLVKAWVEEQRTEGRTGAELAAILNEQGRWNTDSPESGLPELFPDLKGTLQEVAESELVNCGIAIAAGVADPAAVRDVDWLEAEQAESDLGYCIRTACGSLVAWDAPPAIVLYSSHASQNEHWDGNLYIDVFATGQVAAPGGYCAIDGALADEFQG